MRVDRFLFFIRVLKSRTQAQGLIDEGHVRIDGARVVKHSEEVRVGSVITFSLHDRVRILRVLELPTRLGPASERGPVTKSWTLTSRSPRHSETSKGSELT